jgi:proteasome lid subunit RPN8/RPN11
VTRPFPPARIRIRQLALAKLLLYADRCPAEIGGLGYVVWQGGDLLVSDLFILPQKVSVSDTELDPDALFTLLERVAQANRDVASVRLWWHSHGDMDLLWSATDCATIENLPGDFWVAILVNRKGQVRCRLDAFRSGRETWELPLEEVPEEEEVDLEALRSGIEQEILDQVRMRLVIEEEARGEETAETGGESPLALGCEAAAARREQGQLHIGK